jgi:eukaryotic-like serine/threonine-protein kinase
MNCPDLEEIERLVRGELEGVDAGSLSTHLESCAQCAGLAEEVRANESFQSDWQRVFSGPPLEGVDESRIPGYRLLREVHRGGQGVVYAANQESTHRQVAVKLLHQGAFATARQRRRFEREIDLAASLNHPNIVTVFDSGQTETGELYFAMELVDGCPLDEYLEDDELTDEQRLQLFVQICEAVHHAHQRGILHRDLKPGNILVDKDGRPRVVDFGLAKPLDISAVNGPFDTAPGMFIGTLAYSSPEQLQEDSDGADVRSDVYGLGVILFQILTGDLPYDVSGPLVSIALQIIEKDPARPSSIQSRIDAELDAIVAKALEKRPRDRYQSVVELGADVENHLFGEPVNARSSSAWYVLRKRFRRHRLGITAASLIFLSLIVATVVSGVFWRRSAADRDRAIQEQEHLREVRSFQLRMIAMASPYAEGHSVTVAELLDSAARDLAGEYQDQPVLRAELESTIADSYSGLRLLVEAERHYATAWELLRVQRGEHDPTTLDARLGMISARAETQPLEEVEVPLEEFVEVSREHLGAEHRVTQNAVTALARLRENQGRLTEAEELYALVLEVDQRRGPAAQEERITALQNLSACLLTQGRPEEAEPIVREMYEWCKENKGPEHSATLSAANVLGQTWYYLSRFEESEALLRRTLEARRRIFGDDSWVTCKTLNGLGLCLLDKGEIEEASEILQEAVTLGRAQLPPHNLELLRVQRSLGGAFWRLGRLGEALEILEQTHEALVEHHEFGHPDAIATQLGVGCVLQASHRFEEAAGVFEELLSRCPDTHPDHVNFLSQVKLYLGFCLIQAGSLEEAEALFLEALDELQAELGPAHGRTQIAVEALISLYENTGRSEEATRYRERAAKAAARADR